MALPVKVRRLTEQEGQKLQHIVRRGSTNSVRFRRAMMLLASAGGSTVPVIAHLVQADEDTVRDVIHRFNEIGLACLDPQWTGGRPRLLSGDDEDFVVRTAAARPTVLGKPFTRWSIRKLADHLRRDVARPVRIGRETLRCLPARRGISFQRTKTWKEPRTRRSTPSWNTLSTRSMSARTARSRSTSSGRWASAPLPAPAGPDTAGPSGCRPRSAAPTASPISTAATRSATTNCGASTASAKASTTPGPPCAPSARPARTAPRST